MPQLLADWSYASLIRLRNADYEDVLGCRRPKTKTKTKLKAAKGFFDLPAEVRNQVYGYLVSPNLPDLSKGSSPVGSIAASTEWDINIMFVNRQTYHEASSVFYLDHLFVRVQFTNTESVLSSIHALGLDQTIRKNAYYCPRINITLNFPDPYRGFGCVDVVMAYHDIALINSLLLCTVEKWRIRSCDANVHLHVRLTICKPLVAKPPSFCERFLRPLECIPCLQVALPDHQTMEKLVGIPNESPRLPSKEDAALKRRLIKFPNHHRFFPWDAEKTLSLDESLMDDFVKLHLATARVLEHHGKCWGADLFLAPALSVVEALIQGGFTHSVPDCPKDVDLVKTGIELLAYRLSLGAREIGSNRAHQKGHLGTFRNYYHALNRAHGSERIIPLFTTIETFLACASRWAMDGHGRPIKRGYLDHLGSRMVDEILSWDPNDELGFGLFHKIHEYKQWLATLSFERRWDEEHRSDGSDVDTMMEKFLKFAELAKLFTRLYQITGLDRISA